MQMDGPYGTVRTLGLCVDYGMNLQIGGTGPPGTATKRSEIRCADKTALFADVFWFSGAWFGNASFNNICPRHTKRTRANFVLCDGHVESCRFSQTPYGSPDVEASFAHTGGRPVAQRRGRRNCGNGVWCTAFRRNPGAAD